MSGEYFYHLRPRTPDPRGRDHALQDALIAACEEISGVPLPASESAAPKRGTT